MGSPSWLNPNSCLYPVNWINLLVPVRVGVTLPTLFHVWLAGFGMYLFSRYMGGRRLPCFGRCRLCLWRSAGRAIVGGASARVVVVFIWTPLMLAAWPGLLTSSVGTRASCAGVPLALSFAGGARAVIFIRRHNLGSICPLLPDYSSAHAAGLFAQRLWPGWLGWP